MKHKKKIIIIIIIHSHIKQNGKNKLTFLLNYQQYEI